MTHVDNSRKRDLAVIHLAKKQLNLDDDAYRDLLFSIARVRSSKDLDWTGRKRVLEHFEKIGFKRAVPFTKEAGVSAEAKKLWVLWRQLHSQGKVKVGTQAALNNFVERQTGMSHIRFCNSHQLSTVIESLKKWLARPASEGNHG